MSQACFVAAEPTARQWSSVVSGHSLFKLRSVKSPSSVAQNLEVSKSQADSSKQRLQVRGSLEEFLLCQTSYIPDVPLDALACRLRHHQPFNFVIPSAFWLICLATSHHV